MRILFYYRKNRPGRNFSIERLFSALAEKLSDKAEIVQVKAPELSNGIKNRISIIRHFQQQKADIIHLTGDIYFAAIFYRKKAPLVLTYHDLRVYEQASPWKRAFFWFFWIYLPCLRANSITCISADTRRVLLRAMPSIASRLTYIPNFVDPAIVFKPRVFPEPGELYRILHIGTADNKNLERVIQACKGLNVELEIVGVLTPQQQQLLEQNKLRYHNSHSITDPALRDLLYSSHLLVFCSTYEGFGLPIIEAQAAGLPVITAALEPMITVAGKGALVVNPFQVEAIRAAIIQLTEQQVLREQLLQAGLENVKQYSLEDIAAQYWQLYRSLGSSS